MTPTKMKSNPMAGSMAELMRKVCTPKFQRMVRTCRYSRKATISTMKTLKCRRKVAILARIGSMTGMSRKRPSMPSVIRGIRKTPQKRDMVPSTWSLMFQCEATRSGTGEDRQADPDGDADHEQGENNGCAS
jgi:hypothetical protein